MDAFSIIVGLFLGAWLVAPLAYNQGRRHGAKLVLEESRKRADEGMIFCKENNRHSWWDKKDFIKYCLTDNSE